jgi:cytochrome c oxidase subunit 3
VSAKTSPLAHHFENLEQQHHANVLGMWLFLATEVLVFGGLFAAYTVYRVIYPAAWSAGSRELNIWIGGGNTLVLLTSSFTMAMGVYYAQTGNRHRLVGCLLATMALGVAFLVAKGFEYYQDYEEKLIPGLNFTSRTWGEPRERRAELPNQGPGPLGAAGEVRGAPQAGSAGPPGDQQELDRRVQLFFLMYYIMTGLHAVHLIVGLCILAVLGHYAWREHYTPEYYTPIEVGGLYWHLIDVIWIFLLPMLYLVG